MKNGHASGRRCRFAWSRSFADPRVFAMVFRALCAIIGRVAFVAASLLLGRTGVWRRLLLLGRPDIANGVRAAGTVIIDPQALAALPPLPRLAAVSRELQRTVLLPLASCSVEPGDDLFERTFSDAEDAMAVHRFGWALQLLHEDGSAERIGFVLDQMSRWCDLHPVPSRSGAFGAYTVSERLVSWIFLLMLAQDRGGSGPDLARKIARSIGLQLGHLARNLEYRGPLTNNHVLNNARALYFCGALLRSSAIRDLGARVLFRETDRHIVGGVLREDSSHYQMLLTRSLLEIALAARLTNDTGMSGWIAPRLGSMLAVCDRLQGSSPQGGYPLFGDVSPDFPPSWTAGYPFCSRTETVSPWHDLIGSRTERVAPSPSSPPAPAPPAWLYRTHGRTEVWAVAKQGIACHGHNDNGSIVVHHARRPVLIDLGLVGYAGGGTAAYQTGWRGHNAPLIDGIPPDIDRSSFFSSPHLRSGFTLLQDSPGVLAYRVVYAGSAVQLDRSIEFGKDSLAVSDRPSGPKDHCTYHARWHVAAAVTSIDRRGPGSMITFSDGTVLTVALPASRSSVETGTGRRTVRYGITTDVSTVLVSTVLGRQDRVQLTFAFGDRA